MFWSATHRDHLLKNLMLIRRLQRTSSFFTICLWNFFVLVSLTAQHSVTAALFPISNSMSASLLHYTAALKCNFSRVHKDHWSTSHHSRTRPTPICPPLAPWNHHRAETSHSVLLPGVFTIWLRHQDFAALFPSRWYEWLDGVKWKFESLGWIVKKKMKPTELVSAVIPIMVRDSVLAAYCSSMLVSVPVSFSECRAAQLIVCSWVSDSEEAVWLSRGCFGWLPEKDRIIVENTWLLNQGKQSEWFVIINVSSPNSPYSVHLGTKRFVDSSHRKLYDLFVQCT